MAFTIYIALLLFLLYAIVAEGQRRMRGRWPNAAFVKPLALPTPPALTVALVAYAALLALDGAWMLGAPWSPWSSGVLFAFGGAACVAAVGAWWFPRARTPIYSAFTVQAIDLFQMFAPGAALARVEMWRLGIITICVLAQFVDRREREGAREE